MLMMLVLAAAGCLGLIDKRAVVQRAAVIEIERAGGHVIYNLPHNTRWKNWVADHIGIEYVGTVVYVNLP
ncbi:MAG TPA: hypothetical protein VGY53_07705, partial [Isosphaeraceae bacterium]|nr:hypothetical protein [Isosphaeraceae bacterium]